VAQDYAKRRPAPTRKKPSPRKAQAQRHTGEPQPPSKGFRLYMTGVITGVFLSFMVYLGTLPKPIEPGQEVAGTPQQEVEPETPKPRFDFYTLLPEQTMEVEGEGEIETVEPAADVSKPPTTAVAAEPYFLQAGSFRQQEDAERRRAELLLLGLEPKIEESNVDNGRWFRVSLGPFESHDAVSRARGLLANQNIDSVLLKRGGT
jgi:cell division protein FtsN